MIKRLLQHKLIRFFIISGVNTIFGYGLFALLIFLDMPYPIAVFIGTIAGILFNFKTIGSFVFKSNDNILIFKFFGVYGVTFLGNIAGLALFKYFGVSEYIGGAILLFPMGVVSFFLNKFFVFSSASNDKS